MTHSGDRLWRLRSFADQEEPVSAISASESAAGRVSRVSGDFDMAAYSGPYRDMHRPEVSPLGDDQHNASAPGAAPSHRPIGSTSPPGRAIRRESANVLKRVPVGSKNTSPDPNRLSPTFSPADFAQSRGHETEPLSANLESPWEHGPAVTGYPFDEASAAPGTRDARNNAAHRKVSPSTSTSTAPVPRRKTIDDIDDEEDEFDNALFNTKYSMLPPSRTLS